MNNNRYTRFIMPLAFAGVLVLGIFMGSRLNQPFIGKKPFFHLRTGQFNKLQDVINYISQEYVDTVTYQNLVEDAITSLLHNLDPHSAYIPAAELQAMNEPLEGNFDGIGVEFHIQNDTIMVVTPVSGGPSESLGIKPGDRILKIEGETVAGKGITNIEVMQKLRGPKGTKVNVSIARKGSSRLIDYTITRGKIPIYSVDAAYMTTDDIGYIKISRFGATTYDEFKVSLERLLALGMQKMIIDLRGNPGGYLNAATMIADELLPDGKMIVYTEGKARPRLSYKSSQRGSFQEGDLAILVDEGSASASEILAGALQDWDRATIIGRRTFGKGLVQEQTVFPDGSALRLTIARYYTPTGRSIQKPYSNGYDEYNREVAMRAERGELMSTDSIIPADTVTYTTPAGKVLHGGGGIMPDIFVPLDTSFSSAFFTELIIRGIISQFSYDYLDKNRAAFKKFKTIHDYTDGFEVTNRIMDDFIKEAYKNGVPRDLTGVASATPVIKKQIKAYIARQLWKSDGFLRIWNQDDNAFLKALESLQEGGP